MNARYRLTYRGVRGGMFYYFDKKLGKRFSLGTRDEAEAKQLVEAKNIAERQPTLNMQIAKAYIAGSDTGVKTRTWREAMPLNNPPRFPRYNGGMEKSIRDFKSALALRQLAVPSDFALATEVVAHELNHRSRRCLKGRTACAVFYDDAQRLRWTKRQRQTIFRLLLCKFGAMIGKTTNGRHPRPATAWRVTVEAWLRCQELITVRQNQKPNVSTASPKIWSHN